ncbi:TetR/AcrR family transcriptional regulator [Streptosporangium sp. NPDC000509]|uniref:TetR/AcrR family transcriptional regulator n=1 Tax=Streptosporangium sp. NPDC000509 TaxID=3366186 RepID=UPI00368E3101
MSERADAARNRRAILRAAEELLAAHDARDGAHDGARGAHISLDQVAAHAQVGKGTVFRRFGSRTGLMQALLQERAAQLREALESGPPPLGPGAPPAERIVAFLDALCRLAADNLALLAAHERSCALDRHADPTYVRWHTHLQTLITQARPDLDAGFVAHTLLGMFDADMVRRLTPRADPGRFARSMRQLVGELLT